MGYNKTRYPLPFFFFKTNLFAVVVVHVVPVVVVVFVVGEVVVTIGVVVQLLFF